MDEWRPEAIAFTGPAFDGRNAPSPVVDLVLAVVRPGALGARWSGPVSVPILVIGGVVIADSFDIARWADEHATTAGSHACWTTTRRSASSRRRHGASASRGSLIAIPAIVARVRVGHLAGRGVDVMHFRP